MQLALHRLARIKQIWPNQGHKREESEVLASVWRPREEYQRLELLAIIEFLDQAVGQSHAGSFVKVEVVRLVDNNQIPGLGQQHSLMAPFVIFSECMERSHNLGIEFPEINSASILFRIILNSTNVEHAEKALLPLRYQRSRAENEQAANQAKLE
jgi:hypothetical protein